MEGVMDYCGQKLNENGIKQKPTKKDMLESIEKSDMSDEMKASMKAMLDGDVMKIFGGFSSGAITAVLFVLIVFSSLALLFWVVVLGILVFFGYKLDKAIKEKEMQQRKEVTSAQKSKK